MLPIATFSNPSLAALLESLERQLLTPATRTNSEALESLLAEEFTEFGSSGQIYNRAQIIATLSRETPSPPSLTLTGFAVQQLSPELVLATYRSHRAEPPTQSLRSSLWIFRDSRWQILFHQGTPIPPQAP